MTHDEFQDKQYHLSVAAGMNQRYHQSRAHFWLGWNRTAQIIVATFAVIGVILACVAPIAKATPVDILSIVIASLAAIAAIALNVIPLGDWAREHLDLFRRWSDLREDIDAILFDLTETLSPELISRIKELDAKSHRICGSEPGCKKKLLEACYREEERSRRPNTSCSAIPAEVSMN